MYMGGVLNIDSPSKTFNKQTELSKRNNKRDDTQKQKHTKNSNPTLMK